MKLTDLTAKEAAGVMRRRRSSGLKRLSGPKLEKRVSPKADRGRVRDNPFLAYLRRQPCCVGPLMADACQGRTDPAHLRFTDRSVGRTNPGLSRKSDDRWCLPVCRKHHDAQHAYGNEAKWWTAVVGADPNELAKQFYAAFNQEASHD